MFSMFKTSAISPYINTPPDSCRSLGTAEISFDGQLAIDINLHKYLIYTIHVRIVLKVVNSIEA